ncbi:zinc finger protein 628-like [Penaeus japonicus]|uniref:zinc finger protein 628-like n=1 Tax=Penaeus japonicus TaxID=27405 RepID=UPI001C70DF5D|nr:zinc finger protein 628-like [Penaeus japonicus]
MTKDWAYVFPGSLQRLNSRSFRFPPRPYTSLLSPLHHAHGFPSCTPSDPRLTPLHPPMSLPPPPPPLHPSPPPAVRPRDSPFFLRVLDRGDKERRRALRGTSNSAATPTRHAHSLTEEMRLILGRRDPEGAGVRCPVCGRFITGVNRKQNLERHMLTHSGERPFRCPYCPHGSNRVDNLKLHIRRVHLLPASTSSTSTHWCHCHHYHIPATFPYTVAATRVSGSGCIPFSSPEPLVPLTRCDADPPPSILRPSPGRPHFQSRSEVISEICLSSESRDAPGGVVTARLAVPHGASCWLPEVWHGGPGRVEGHATAAGDSAPSSRRRSCHGGDMSFTLHRPHAARSSREQQHQRHPSRTRASSSSPHCPRANARTWPGTCATATPTPPLARTTTCAHRSPRPRGRFVRLEIHGITFRAET